MPYLLPDKKIAVFFSPKGAGTSLRAFLFELENGFAFRPYRVQGTEISANNLVANTRFRGVDHDAIAGWRRFAVVRDPVKRLLSAYSNRVLHYKELSVAAAGEALRKKGLAADPDVETFFANIDGYRGVSKWIRRHTQPQEYFLGPDQGYFDAIYRVEDIGVFAEAMNTEYGTSAVMPREQTGGPKFAFEALPEATKQAVVDTTRSSIIFDWVPTYKEAYATYLNAEMV